MVYTTSTSKRIVQRKNLDDEVYEKIFQMIADGTIRCGDRLSVDWISEQTGVSKTPVISALKRLCFENILFTSRSKGYYVKVPDHDEVVAVAETSELFNEYALKELIQRASEQDIEQIAQAAALTYGAYCNRNIEEYRVADNDFHDLLYMYANAYVKDFYYIMKCKTSIWRSMIEVFLPQENRFFNPKFHAMIVEGLQHRDVDLAIQGAKDENKCTLQLLSDALDSGFFTQTGVY